MNIYIFLLFLLYILTFVPQNKTLDIFLFCMVFIISGFRDTHVGTDTINYISAINLHADLFENLLSGEISGNVVGLSSREIELLYNLVNYIIRITDTSARMIIVFMSGMTLFFLYKALQKFNTNARVGLFMFLLLFFYCYSLNIARQMMAASILLYAYGFLVERKRLMFLAFGAVATMFHATSIIFCLLVFIPEIKIEKEKWKKWAIISILISISINHIAKDILLLLFQSFELNIYSVYTDFFTVEQEKSTAGIIHLALVQVFLVIIIHLRDKNITALDVLFILSIILQNIFLGSHGYLYRLFLNITIIQVVYIANTLVNINSKPKRFLLSLGILIIWGYSFWTNIQFTGEILPYSFSFNL